MEDGYAVMVHYPDERLGYDEFPESQIRSVEKFDGPIPRLMRETKDII